MVHIYFSPNKKKEVLEIVAMIIMYDHSYQKVNDVGGLTRTWVQRLDDVFVSGAD